MRLANDATVERSWLMNTNAVSSRACSDSSSLMIAAPDHRVERRRHLVAEDDVRLRRERAGEVDALLLPARKLVREAPGVVRRQLHHVQQLPYPPVALRAVHPEIELERPAEGLHDELLGLNDTSGICSTSWTRCRSSLSRCFTSGGSAFPSSRTSPSNAGVRPEMTRAIVDFPQPDSPMTPTA